MRNCARALIARCSRRDVRLGMFLVELDESDARQAARATVPVKEDGGQRLAGMESSPVSTIRALPLHCYLLLGSES
jgi:hypothetical protein